MGEELNLASGISREKLEALADPGEAKVGGASR